MLGFFKSPKYGSLPSAKGSEPWALILEVAYNGVEMMDLTPEGAEVLSFFPAWLETFAALTNARPPRYVEKRVQAGTKMSHQGLEWRWEEA